MYLTLPPRDDAPETKIFTRILRKNARDESSWDRPILLLIHGGPGGNHTLYRDIEEELLEIADLVMFDLRGCGLSDKSDVTYCTLDIHIDDIHSILQILHLPPVVMHGCSYGAMVALGYAIKYSDQLPKLILSSGAASGEFIARAKHTLEIRGTALQIEAAKKLWNGTFESPDDFSLYYKIMSPLYFYNSEEAQKPPASAQNIPYNVELVNFAFTHFLLEFDYRPMLGTVNAETLIICGRNDWITGIEEAETISHGIKKSTLLVLDHCGHFPWKDQKEAFLEGIKCFVETTQEKQLEESQLTDIQCSI